MKQVLIALVFGIGACATATTISPGAARASWNPADDPRGAAYADDTGPAFEMGIASTPTAPAPEAEPALAPVGMTLDQLNAESAQRDADATASFQRAEQLIGQ